MCVCVCTYLEVYVDVDVYLCIVGMCVRAYRRGRMYVCVHSFMHVCVCVCVPLCVCVCVCVISATR